MFAGWHSSDHPLVQQTNKTYLIIRTCRTPQSAVDVAGLQKNIPNEKFIAFFSVALLDVGPALFGGSSIV